MGLVAERSRHTEPVREDRVSTWDLRGDLQTMHSAWRCLGVVLGGLALVAGCTREGVSETEAPTPEIVCTTGQVADLVRHVTGDRVRCVALMGAGVDPHLYKPSHRDLRKLLRARVVFYNGLHLEGRLADVLETLSRRQPTFAVTEVLIQQHYQRLRSSPDFAGHYDPHVWFDVALWAECLPAIAERLAVVWPEHAVAFREAARSYQQDLQAIDEDCRRKLAEIPDERRVLVTAHDAFGYWGQAYGMEVHGLQGLSTADEADLRSLNDLVTLLVERRIKAIFVESSVPRRNVEALVNGCAARGHQLVVGGELYSDAMGPPGSPAESYTGMLRHNLSTMVRALK